MVVWFIKQCKLSHVQHSCLLLSSCYTSSAISHPNHLLPQPRVLSESLGSCFSHLLTPGPSLTVWLVSHWSLDLCALQPDYVCFDFASTGQRTRMPSMRHKFMSGSWNLPAKFFCVMLLYGLLKLKLIFIDQFCYLLLLGPKSSCDLCPHIS